MIKPKNNTESPRPWKVEGNAVRDANGDVVISALNPCDMETRKAIVEAVNERGRLRKERDALNEIAAKLRCSRSALIEDNNRLRDLVRRFADNLQRCHINGERDKALLREAREAVGEEER